MLLPGFLFCPEYLVRLGHRWQGFFAPSGDLIDDSPVQQVVLQKTHSLSMRLVTLVLGIML